MKLKKLADLVHSPDFPGIGDKPLLQLRADFTCLAPGESFVFSAQVSTNSYSIVHLPLPPAWKT